MSILISLSYVVLNDYDKENIIKKINFNYKINRINGFDHKNINRKEFFLSKIQNIENEKILGRNIAKLESMLNTNDTIVNKLIDVYKLDLDLQSYNSLFDMFISKIGIGYWMDIMEKKRFKDLSIRELTEKSLTNTIGIKKKFNEEEMIKQNLENNMLQFNYEDIEFEENTEYTPKYESNVINYEFLKDSIEEEFNCDAYNIVFPNENSELWNLNNQNHLYNEELMYYNSKMNDYNSLQKTFKDFSKNYSETSELKKKTIENKKKISLKNKKIK